MKFLLLTGTLLLSLIGQTAFGGNNCKVDTCISPNGKTYCCPFKASMRRFEIRDEVEDKSEGGQLECMIYNRDTASSSKAIINYNGPFIREITKDINLEIWYKQGTLTISLVNQRILNDFVKVYFDGTDGKGDTAESFKGIWANGHLPAERFDSIKWGYKMSEISCANSVVK